MCVCVHVQESERKRRQHFMWLSLHSSIFSPLRTKGIKKKPKGLYFPQNVSLEFTFHWEKLCHPEFTERTGRVMHEEGVQAVWVQMLLGGGQLWEQWRHPRCWVLLLPAPNGSLPHKGSQSQVGKSMLHTADLLGRKEGSPVGNLWVTFLSANMATLLKSKRPRHWISQTEVLVAVRCYQVASNLWWSYGLTTPQKAYHRYRPAQVLQTKAVASFMASTHSMCCLYFS